MSKERMSCLKGLPARQFVVAALLACVLVLTGTGRVYAESGNSQAIMALVVLPTPANQISPDPTPQSYGRPLYISDTMISRLLQVGQQSCRVWMRL